MKRLIEQRYLVRHNVLAIIGLCLCVYFTYHAGFGTRSYIGLVSLEHADTRLTAEYNELHKQRLALEDKVSRLRPGSLDRDMLEEQARTVLGFSHPDEQIILR